VRYEFKTSFDRSVSRLDRLRGQHIVDAVEAVIDFFETGDRPEGLGLKQLRKPFWEVRASIRDRVIFAFEDDPVTFILAGSHDDIRRYLKKL
jgi:hypothetical protein